MMRQEFRRTLQYYRHIWIQVAALAVAALVLVGIAIWSLTNPFKAMSLRWGQVALPAGNPQVTVANPEVNWCLVGDFQEWDATSHPLNDAGMEGDAKAGDGIYSRQVAFPEAGVNSWQVLQCDNWDVVIPPDLAWVNTTSANEKVTITFSPSGAALADAPGFPDRAILNADDVLPSLTAVGDFQGWANDNPDTLMTKVNDTTYELTTTIFDPTRFSAYVVLTGQWIGFGADGRSMAPTTFSVNTTEPSETVRFFYDTETGKVTILSGVPGWLEFMGYSFGWVLLSVLALLLALVVGVMIWRLVVMFHPYFWLESGCPNCDAEQLYRVKDVGWVYYLGLINMPSSRYKCTACGWEGIRTNQDVLL